MSKKAVVFASFALLIACSGGVFAQKAQFNVAPPNGGIVQLPDGTDLGLRNIAEMTPDELREALETPTCSNSKEVKSATRCAACTALNCTGTCFSIPCGNFANASQQVPPVAGFRSFVTGCTNTFVSTCANLSGVAPCQLFAFASATWGNNTCINSNTLLLKSVGCQ